MFTIPDRGEATDTQSIFFQEHLDILNAGLSGIDCVLSGGAVTAQGTPNMTVAVEKCGVLSNRVMFAVAAANGTITAADATNPRLDLVVITSSGAIAVRAGTPNASPKPATRTANDVVLATVYVPANATSITSWMITDSRVIPRYPLCVWRQTTVYSANNISTAVDMLNNAGAGVTIPSGLLVAGRGLRLRCGGNLLQNAGVSRTLRIIVAYGGVTMFSDLSGNLTDSTVRKAWSLDLDIFAQGDADQTMVGSSSSSALVAITAPTTGIGDMWGTADVVSTISGAGTANSTTADRKLQVTLTWSAANSLTEMLIEYAYLELY